MRFDWDAEKAAANEWRHSVPFEAAREVFSDLRHITSRDERRDYGEERRVAVGQVDGVLLTVVYTMREDVCRIISARTATEREERLYVERSRSRHRR